MATVDSRRNPLPSVPLASLLISRRDPRAADASPRLMAFSNFRVWLHKQRDPSLVSCIDFMLTLYSCSPTAKKGLTPQYWMSQGFDGAFCISRDDNEERALLRGVCLG